MNTMNDRDEDRSPEEIQSDIDQIRAQVSSTIDAIQSKLTPGQVMDQTLAYFRGGGAGNGSAAVSEFAGSLGRAVQANPLPVAVIGMGLAWLMVSSQRGTGTVRSDTPLLTHDTSVGSRGSLSSASSSMHGSAGASNNLFGAVHHASSSSASSASSGGVMQSVQGAVSSATSSIADVGRSLRDKASEVTDRVTGRARDMTYSARETMNSTTLGAKARLSDLGDRSVDQYYRARGSVSRMVDEQPLVLAAIGVAIGAALGAVLPATRKEDELLGRTRDDLAEKAAATALGQVDTVKETAQRVMDSAKQEIQRAVGSEDGARQSSQSGPETSGSSASGPSSGATSGASMSGGMSGQSSSGMQSAGQRERSESLEHAHASGSGSTGAGLTGGATGSGSPGSQGDRSRPV